MNSKDKKIIHNGLKLTYDNLKNDPFRINTNLKFSTHSTGLCRILMELEHKSVIIESERNIIKKYIFDYIFIHRCYGSTYLFPFKEIKSRLEWLEEHIELTKPDSNE